MNIQDEAMKIHSQYGTSEMANYKLQLLAEQYAKEYHESEVKTLSLPVVNCCKITKDDVGVNFRVINNTSKHDFYIGEIVEMSIFDDFGTDVFIFSNNRQSIALDFAEIERL